MQNNIINLVEFLDDSKEKTFYDSPNASRKAKLSKDPSIIKGKISKLKPQAVEAQAENTVPQNPTPMPEVASQEVTPSVEVVNQEQTPVEPQVEAQPEEVVSSNQNEALKTFELKGATVIPIDVVYDGAGTNYNRLRVSSQVVEKSGHANQVLLANLKPVEETPTTEEQTSVEPQAEAQSEEVAPTRSEEVKEEVPASSLQSFDFNQTVDLKNIENEASEGEEIKEEETKPTPTSKVNIDDYIGMSNDETVSDYTLDEMKKLQSENDSLKESIETQLGVLKSLKEKQEQLRKEKIVLIDDYRAQKAEYTQKLNKILEEINKATDEVEAETAYIEEVKGRIN